MSQKKIMEIHEGRWQYEVIKTDEKTNPYRLYRTWWDMGKHRKLITKYGDIQSVIATLDDIIVRGRPEADYYWGSRMH